MKAIEALKQINAIFSEYVAIAKDRDGNICVYNTFHLKIDSSENMWCLKFSDDDYKDVSNSFAKQIEWDSDDWTKCIATLNDIENEMQGKSKV